MADETVVYCVWAGDNYYPTGPGDLKGVFFNEEDADALEESLRNEKKSWSPHAPYYDRVTQTQETVE